MFKVVVEEIFDEANPPQTIERYTQIVDALDLRALIDVLNTPPKPPRKRRERKVTP